MNRHSDTLIILVPGFPANEDDSTCLPFQQTLVISLQQLNPAIRVIILAFQYPYVNKCYEWKGITVQSFNGQNRPGWKRWMLRRRIDRTIRDIHRSSCIIGILSFWYGECAFAGESAAKKYRLKHYCWLMGQDAKSNNRYPARVNIPGNKLIALSDFLQMEFEKNHGIHPAYVILPGIDESSFPPLPLQKDIDLLAVGSLIPLKQFELFVGMVMLAKNENPSITGVLIGEGPERERLQAMIQQRGLEDSLIMTGELPHSIVLEWMSRSKILIHPSSYEGFGMVMLEALYAGCHVISFTKPLETEIHRWNVAATKEEMGKIISSTFQSNTVHQRLLFRSINDVTREILELFTEGVKS